MGDYWWEPLTPREGNDLLAGLDVPWWIAGGYAIELFVGTSWREHSDLDVVVLRPDQLAAQTHLVDRGWDLHAADPPGTLRPWRNDEYLPVGVHDIWCRPSPESAWQLQLMLAETECDPPPERLELAASSIGRGPEPTEWWFRRDPRIRGLMAELGATAQGGLPILAPEIQLLFKGKAEPRPRDELDFKMALPELNLMQRTWLEEHLRIVHPEGHPWIERLQEARRGPR